MASLAQSWATLWKSHFRNRLSWGFVGGVSEDRLSSVVWTEIAAGLQRRIVL